MLLLSLFFCLLLLPLILASAFFYGAIFLGKKIWGSSISNGDKKSKKHLYNVASISKEVLKGVKPDKWIKKNTTYTQINSKNVEFSIRVSMS